MLATTANEQLRAHAQGAAIPPQLPVQAISAAAPSSDRPVEDASPDEKQQGGEPIASAVDASLDDTNTIKMLVASVKSGPDTAIVVMHTLLTLARGNERAQIRIGEAGGVDALYSLFSVNQPGTTELLIPAVALLKTLANAAENIPRLAVPEIVLAMLSVFPEAAPDLQLAIVELLNALHDTNQSVPDTLMQEGAQANLFSVLQLNARVLDNASVRTAVIVLLGKLAAADPVRRDSIATNINLFVAAIRDGSGDEPEAAVNVTAKLVNDLPALVATAALRGGVVDAFVRMITTAERVDSLIPKIEQAIAKLGAIRSTEAKAGAIAIVRAMMELSQSASGRHSNAVAAKLVTWVKAWNYRELLVDAGIVQVAAFTLTRDVEDERVLGSFTLHHAMTIMSVIGLSDQNSKLVDEGATDALIMALKKTQPGFRDETTMILYNTAWSYPPLRPLLRTSGCLEVFVDMLRDGTQEEKDAAAGALAAACIDCKMNVARLPHNELLDLCVPMLLTGEGHSPNAALRLIKSLADDPATGEDVARHATIVNLSVQLLSRRDSGNQIHAALAVESFAHHSVSRQQMIQAGVEEALKNIRRGEPASYARFALDTLRRGSDRESDEESDEY